MTLSEFLTALASYPTDAPLVFTTEEGAIGGGYHVTEFKLSDVTSIDCGATVSTWQEAAMQLLDVSGGHHMAVGKFAAIATQSMNAVPGLGDSTLSIEFAHGNRGKHIYQIGNPFSSEAQVTVPLSAEHAVCKPASALQSIAVTSSCCGVGAGASGCC